MLGGLYRHDTLVYLTHDIPKLAEIIWEHKQELGVTATDIYELLNIIYDHDFDKLNHYLQYGRVAQLHLDEWGC